MVASLAAMREDVARANRILANEGVLDAFGHVSLRHPSDRRRYLLARSRAPELVEPGDVLEYDLESKPVRPTNERLYSERVIHGEIYKARPDVQAVVHHHAPAIMPFCITGMKMIPVFHLGATIGESAPFWNQKDEFGDTNLLVVKPDEGRSLARALGPHSIVLMNRHGATVVGANVRELVFRAIYSCRNAEFQLAAQAIGNIQPLSPGEIERASALNAQPNVTSRTWEYWVMRLKRCGNDLPVLRQMKVNAAAKVAPARSKPKGRK